MNKSPFKTIILLSAFLLLPVDFIAAELYAKAINIPSNLGMVKEVYETNSALPSAGRTIIHIQDAHCNYEAQKNMAQVLEYLVKEDNLKLILVEGGSGDVSLSFLRAYADKKAREEVADKYLKEGKISGEEYLDIISESPLQLYGIEDKGLYDAHLDSFQKIDSFRGEGLVDLGVITGIVKDLKPRIYSSELLQLEEKKGGYEAKAIALAEYCRYLSGMADSKKLNLDNYPHLAAFSETARLEKEIDPKQVETQRNAFIKDLAKVLDERGAKNLILMTQGFKANMVSAEKYYSFLGTAGGEKINLKRKYPQLYAYITYITTGKDVNAAELLKDVSAIEDGIKEALLTNPEERNLANIDKAIYILTKAMNLELSPEDYAYFKANKSSFNTASWAGFLMQECDKYRIARRPQACAVIDNNFAELERFYQLGTAREEAFIKNMAVKIKDSGEKTAVLITGGFHTPGITRMLKDRNYSYMVVTPAVTQKGDSGIYLSVLRAEKKDDEYFSDEE